MKYDIVGRTKSEYGKWVHSIICNDDGSRFDGFDTYEEAEFTMNEWIKNDAEFDIPIEYMVIAVW